MIPKIQKILYATDLTENSAYAFRYAAKAAQQDGAEVSILHVLEDPRLPFYFAAEEGMVVPETVVQLEMSYAEQKKLAKEKIQGRLEKFCQQEFQGNTDLLKKVVSIEVAEGDPAAKILEKADELKADMVVMGTHGKGWLAHTFLGSEAEKVLQRTKIPVLIIPILEKREG